MIDRETVKRAAKAVDGQAVLLPYVWDRALMGYVIQAVDAGNKAVGVYDYDIALWAGTVGLRAGSVKDWQDVEDKLLDDLRDCKGLHGVEPVVMHTNRVEPVLEDDALRPRKAE